MSYVMEKCLKPVLEEGERPVSGRGLHWIFLFSGFSTFVFLAAIGWAADIGLWNYFGTYVPTYEIYNTKLHFSLQPGWIGWFFSICGGLIFSMEFTKYLTTRVFVTTKRIVIKRGWINIRFDQTDLSDVRGIHVDQGWLGRFFNYGKITLDCRFVKDVFFQYVSRPYDIVGAMQKMKTQVEEHLAGIDEQSHMPQTGQTIININTSAEDGRTMLEHGGERIVIETTHPAMPVQKKLSSDILHDEILEDFKKKH